MAAKQEKAVVLGAGFAGLWLSRRLLDQGFEVEILEQSSQPGGLMETIVRDEFILDLGPHILLASHLDSYREILGKSLLDIRGFYGFGYQGKQILSPLSPGNLFKTLGLLKAVPFAASMAWNRLPFARPRPPWENVDRLLTARFGGRVNEALFRNYVPKVTGLPSTEVSEEWFLERYRFYREHSLGKQLLKKALQPLKNRLLPGAREDSAGLELYYPEKGAQMLTDALFRDISQRGACVKLGTTVTGIQAGNGQVDSVSYEIAGGGPQQAEGDFFASTLPVTHLARLFAGGGEGLGTGADKATKALSWRHLWLFYVVVDRERVSDKIQIYFTEQKYPFKRIYEPRNLVPAMGRAGKTALCIEVCYSDGDVTDRADEQANFRAVKEGVCDFYGLAPGEVHFLFSRKVPYSYAVYRKGYQEHLATLAAALFPLNNVVSYGRQGSFRYNHLVDRIIDASDSVMDYIADRREGKGRFLNEPSAKSDFF